MPEQAEILAGIRSRFDARRALDLCRRIWETDSEFTFRAFHRTARLVAAEMERAGLKDIEICSFRADGRTVYGDWTVPRAWDVERAELWIRADGSLRKLADRSANKCNVMMYSASTPNKAPAECRIVRSDRPSKWKGNLVFVENPDKVPPARLAREGALGIVTDFIPMRRICRTPDDVRDVALWNNNYFLPGNEWGLVGFQLSPRNGGILRSALLAGSGVPSKAHVVADLYDGTLDFVTGVLPGSDRRGEEVAVIAHLFEPGANDNASGCAAGLESVRALDELARSGALPRPRRSLRLCYTFEIFGTLALLDTEPDKLKGVVAAVNPDMVGADMEKCRSRLHVYGTPDSAPSYADELLCGYIWKAFEENYLLRWSRKPFMVNDNIVTDPAIGIPCPALICLNDTYYHTSGDVPGNLSGETITAIGCAMAGYLYDAARGEYGRARELVDRLLGSGLAEVCPARLAEGVPAGDSIAYRAETAIRRMRSVSSFLAEPARSDDLRKYVDKSAVAIQNVAACLRRMVSKRPAAGAWRKFLEPDPSLARKARRIFPVKKALGTFRRGLLGGGRPGSISEWSYRLNAPAFWADGTRSIYDIWRNWSLEFQEPVRLREMLSHFEFLERHGYVECARTRKKQEDGR